MLSKDVNYVSLVELEISDWEQPEIMPSPEPAGYIGVVRLCIHGCVCARYLVRVRVRVCARELFA